MYQAFEADGALELFGLCFRALIAPDERGADDFVVRVEKDGAVHLAGKSDAGDGVASEPGGCDGFADGKSGGAPPVAWVLLGPARLWTGKVGVLFGAGGEDGAAVVEDNGASSAGSNINA